MKLSDLCMSVGGAVVELGRGVLYWHVALLSCLHRTPIRLQPSAAVGAINHTTNRAKNPVSWEKMTLYEEKWEVPARLCQCWHLTSAHLIIIEDRPKNFVTNVTADPLLETEIL